MLYIGKVTSCSQDRFKNHVFIEMSNVMVSEEKVVINSGNQLGCVSMID